MALKEYLGTALQFPFQITAEGKLATISDEALLAQSITEYLNTPIGTRFFLGECGSKLRSLVFEQNDEYLEDMLRVYIEECIRIWEKRVKFEKVTFTREGEVMNCMITCVSTQDNLPFTFVYPYYQKLQH